MVHFPDISSGVNTWRIKVVGTPQTALQFFEKTQELSTKPLSLADGKY